MEEAPYMSNSPYMKKKKNPQIDRETEIQSAKMFGKHVSEEKGRVLLVVTMLACAMPMLLGVRLWDKIPQIVATGLIGTNGQDDSLPRWAVVFAIPGLMCLLNLICHLQLRSYQKRMQLPPAKFRIVGRWGFPIISVLFCTGFIRESAGLDAIPLTALAPCVLGLLLLMLGAHLYDCPEDAKVALHFSYLEGNTPLRREVHRFAGWVWMAAGLIAIAGVMVTDTSIVVTGVVVLAALAAPWLFGRSRADSI